MEIIASAFMGSVCVILFNIDIELSRIRTQLRLANERRASK